MAKTERSGKTGTTEDPVVRSAELLQNWFKQSWVEQSNLVLDGISGAQRASVAGDEAMQALQKKYFRDHGQLWQSMMEAGRGQAPATRILPEPGDHRFDAPEWRESPVYDYLHQAYLLNTRYLRELAELLPAESRKIRNRMRFLARQVSDALSPANYAATNPEFIKEAVATQGKNISEGIGNLILDYGKGHISDRKSVV